eukprot:Gregarina_sp_Poly_1__9284@NODE_575_length_7472_cov_59_507225_g449_i0_p2_GENE_NODE_575_length_7472_cov_59_507225_g449_i0NODE_575_length_7472_cov_59_507225_g449_i0_p2_ORF_typecomplete_len301_score46_85zfNOSIP/PF15906_5/3_7e28zfC3HC4_4/PF15227_6/3_2e05Rtf2/PF04641_12/58Rtf2/PF04641_12/9_1e02Rtf2/PF04641_12/2_2e05Ubox/PF04564_15/0_032Ubox/PF04564_15/21zfRING_UBOX/PF13445_6/0_00038zfC3HC4_2/PF13923_6/0_0014zfC3HC4/PF00097_25/0_017zfC3HC4_3/PF13920_6/0_029zfC3HC4_3/PF13920_6/3_4e03Ima1_N/PF09779_9/0_5
MSRHSKNNTASSVFTYHERKNVKGCGSLHERLGLESLRRFEQCWICLKVATRPVATPEGYLYCRDCIIFNFGQQKEDWEKQLSQQRREVALASIDTPQDEKTAAFEQGQKLFEKRDKLVIPKYYEKEVGLFEHSDEEQEIQEMSERIRKREERKRKRLVLETGESSNPPSVSFWAPHETHKGRANIELLNKKRAVVAPSKLIIRCPVSKRPLKLKDLIPVNPTIQESDDGKNKWLCSTSLKELAFQEVCLIKETGELVLKEVLKEVGATKKQTIISMKSGESVFSSHNNVEINLFRPNIG